jgi:glycosyltransferase involved in cell wall biosynthesis
MITERADGWSIPALSRGLRELGHNVVVWSSPQLIAGSRCLRDTGKRWKGRLIQAMYLPLRTIALIRIGAFAMHEHFDALHIFWAYRGIMGRFVGAPYVIHCRGSDVRSNLYIPLLGALTRFSLKGACGVLYSTPDLGAHIHPVRPDAVFLPNAIDVDLFEPFPTKDGRQPRVLFISALSKIKGVDVAVRVMEALRLQRPDIPLYALGFGQEAECVRRRVPYVNFLPRVPHSEMPNLINAYDIVAGQFFLGSLGLSELECMACGKPVVSYFNVYGSYEQEPPVLSTNVPGKVVEYIEALFDDPRWRREVGEASRHWVAASHGHKEVAKRLEGIYRNCRLDASHQ